MENAKKYKLNTPGLFDAIILATCRLLEAKIVTGDEHFKNLPRPSGLSKSLIYWYLPLGIRRSRSTIIVRVSDHAFHSSSA